MTFRRVLIANRGEIACRIAQGLRECGISPVAVISEADRGALHARVADEAIEIGPAEPARSYLNGESVIAAALHAGCQVIHPGYGFLAENAAFAAAVEGAGLVFIGPSPEQIRLAGDKREARTVAQRCNVPVVPGAEGADAVALTSAARRMGFPVMVKAALGGGGKGMRVVASDAELAEALESGRRLAASAFGDASVYLEKRIERVRHVEVQVLGDGAGNAIHLFERDCSLQRRHQKVVEESPSPAIDENLRERLTNAAIAVARALRYRGAGTIEFLVAPSGEFYFLEMNTRLQVEHPVTEMVTGLDLVREQLRIAAGERLGYRQDEVRLRGAAIECRINAEDPFAGFMPSPGTITGLRAAEGPWVRNDSGAYEGYTVPRFYDTLVAKLIVWGADRDAAIRRMARALGEYRIVGVHTTIPVLQRVLAHADFRAARLSTALLERMLPMFRPAEGRYRPVAMIAAALTAYERLGRTPAIPPSPSPGPWRLGARRGWGPPRP